MRYRLLLFFILFIFAFSVDAQISIKTQSNKDVMAGDTLMVSVQVNKNGVQGFGRLLINLPVGLSVSKIDCGDGEYQIQNNQLNITWLRMPSDEILNLKLGFSCAEKDSGNFRVTGDFAWIQMGKKGSASIDPIGFTCKARRNAKINIRPAVLFSETNDTVKVEREQVSVDKKNRIKILLKINKSAYNGAAEIRESIPKGFSLVNQSKMANFKIVKDTAYFSWAKMPLAPFVSEMYILVPNGDKLDNDFAIGGRMIFIDKRKSTEILGFAVAKKKETTKKTLKENEIFNDSKMRSEAIQGILKLIEIK